MTTTTLEQKKCRPAGDGETGGGSTDGAGVRLLQIAGQLNALAVNTHSLLAEALRLNLPDADMVDAIRRTAAAWKQYDIELGGILPVLDEDDAIINRTFNQMVDTYTDDREVGQ